MDEFGVKFRRRARAVQIPVTLLDARPAGGTSVLARCPDRVAGSTGRRNTGVKSLGWGFECQGLTWPFAYTDNGFGHDFSDAQSMRVGKLGAALAWTEECIKPRTIRPIRTQFGAMMEVTF